MKLLLVPIFTSRFISKCSTYYALKQQGLAFLRGGEDRFVYCVIPKEGEPANFVADDVVDHPRWLNLPVRFLTGDRYQNILFPPEGFGQFCNWGSHWDYDVLVTTQNNSWFWRLFSQARPAVDVKAPRLLLLTEAFPLLTFKKTVTWNPVRDAAFVASYLGFDQVTVQSSHEREGILTTARRWLSPAACAQLADRVHVSYPLPRVDLAAAERREAGTGRLQVVYTQRLDAFERRRDDLLEVLRDAFAVSSDVDILITTNALVRGLSGTDTAFATFRQSPREEFYTLLRQCDVSVTWSREEGIPYSLLEACAAGVIPIAKREPWSEEFYGRTYWGLVRTEAEAVAKIRWVAMHRAESRAQFRQWYVKQFRPHVLAAATLETRQEAWVRAHAERLVRRLREGPTTLSSAVGRATVALLDLNDAAWLAMQEGVRLKPTKPMAPPLSRRRDLYVDRLRLLHQWGWHDTADPGVLTREGGRDADGGAGTDTGRIRGEVATGAPLEP